MFGWLKKRIKQFIINAIAEDIERCGKVEQAIIKDIQENIEQNGSLHQLLRNARFAEQRARLIQG